MMVNPLLFDLIILAAAGFCLVRFFANASVFGVMVMLPDEMQRLLTGADAAKRSSACRKAQISVLGWAAAIIALVLIARHA